MNLIKRRLRYAWRFIYWLTVHRSISSVRWVLAHEGVVW